MKKIVSCFSRVLFMWLGITANACAYNEGGHYDTLLALFDSTAHSAPAERLREIRLEAFCAELPDLARELDAISQRVRVLESINDNLWGLIGQCQTTVSSHMVASQYYLHALSGAPAPQLRAAAKAVIRAIDDDLRNPKRAREDRLNLICARGFAAHLYGDTFAHVRLSSERPKFLSGETRTEMYATGLGHARDGHDPDYLYGHSIDINKWPQWVGDAALTIATGADTGSVLASHNGCSGSIADCEKDAQRQLADLLKSKPELTVDMQDLLASGNKGIGNMERASSCDSVVRSVFAGANEGPQCANVWRLYLEKAVPVFYALGIDPTSRPQAGAGKSCAAWRCAGMAAYAGEPPASCAVEITDKLRYGIDPP